MPLRPTPDAMRERAFAVLGDRVRDARFLDVFAGTGAVGLEALSRGARSVVFVEKHRGAAELIEKNCASFDLTTDRTELMVRDAAAAIGRLAPGTGEVNFSNLLRAIERIGYTGYIGLEYMSDLPGDKALSWVPDALRRS